MSLDFVGSFSRFSAKSFATVCVCANKCMRVCDGIGSETWIILTFQLCLLSKNKLTFPIIHYITCAYIRLYSPMKLRKFELRMVIEILAPYAYSFRESKILIVFHSARYHLCHTDNTDRPQVPIIFTYNK